MPLFTRDNMASIGTTTLAHIDRQALLGNLIEFYSDQARRNVNRTIEQQYVDASRVVRERERSAAESGDGADPAITWNPAARNSSDLSTSLGRPGQLTHADRTSQYEFVRDRNVLERYIVDNFDDVITQISTAATDRTNVLIGTEFYGRRIELSVQRRSLPTFERISAQSVLNSLRELHPTLRFSRNGNNLYVAPGGSDQVWATMNPIQRVKEVASWLQHQNFYNTGHMSVERRTEYWIERAKAYITQREQQGPSRDNPSVISRRSTQNAFLSAYVFEGQVGSMYSTRSMLAELPSYEGNTSYVPDRPNALRAARAAVTGSSYVLPVDAPSPQELQTRQNRFEAFMRSKVTSHSQRSRTALTAEAEAAWAAIPMLPHGTLSSRTWGIEIEVVAASYVARAGGTPPEWDRKYDGSLRSADDYGAQTDEDGYCTEHDEDDCQECFGGSDDNDFNGAHEFVSPILKSFHSRGVEHITTALQGAPSNHTPGVHVHVGANGLTGKQIANIAAAYAVVEPLLDPIYRRTERQYCRPTLVEHAAGLSARIDKQAAIPETGSASAVSQQISSLWGERYRTFNLQALYSHNTIEFRAMGPVYEYEHLIKWAWFVREFVNVASVLPLNRFLEAKTLTDVVNLLIEYGHEHVGSTKTSRFQAEFEALAEADRALVFAV